MPVVDLRHLTAQTAGNADLQREVLGLFIDAAPGQIARLRRGPEPERRAVAHQIVGSARAIGAGEVARLASAVETGTGSVEALVAAMGDARTFIAAYLARPG